MRANIFIAVLWMYHIFRSLFVNILISIVISITYIKQSTVNLSEHISVTNYPKVPHVYEEVSDLSKIINFTLNFG